MAVLVSLSLVSAGLLLRRPVEAVAVYDFVGYGVERNRPQDAAAVYNVDEYGVEDKAEEDYKIVDNRDSQIRYGPLGESPTYNVVDYGARGNGRDDSQVRFITINPFFVTYVRLQYN